MLLDFEIHTRPNYSDKDTVAVEKGDELQDVQVATYLPTYAIIWVLLVKHDSGAFFLAVVDPVFTVKLHMYIELVWHLSRCSWCGVVCDNRLRQNALATVQCVPYFNQQKHKLQYSKIDNETGFILGTNSYMFRHQGAALRECINPSKAELNPICYLLALLELTIFSTLAR